MGIIFHEETKTFHLTNGEISYIMTVLPNGHLGNLYYGKAIRDREDFSHLLELVQRPMFQYVYDDDRCRTDFADIQNKKECGGNRQWQNHYLRNWAANTKGKGII